MNATTRFVMFVSLLQGVTSLPLCGKATDGRWNIELTDEPIPQLRPGRSFLAFHVPTHAEGA